MRELIFQFGGEMILVRIEGSHIQFGNTMQGAQLATIDGLNLSKKGVIKEHPDLIDDPNWHQEAISRFKFHIKGLKTEKNRADYITQDLKNYGYILKRIQEGGKRPKIIR